MNEIWDQIFNYYGLDWGGMIAGLTGTYMIMQKKRVGFLCSGAACILGLAVAGMSGQIGYVVYNFLIILMMVKAFSTWKTPAVQKAQ